MVNQSRMGKLLLNVGGGGGGGVLVIAVQKEVSIILSFPPVPPLVLADN